MERDETAKIIAVIRTAYRRMYKDDTPQDIAGMVAVWDRVLKAYSYEDVCMGVDTWLAMDTKGFPPVPGQIIDCINKAKQSPDDMLTEQEAWDLVEHALRCSGYIEDAEREFLQFPSAIKRAIGSASALRNMALADESTMAVEKSNFERSYRVAQAQREETRKLPPVALEARYNAANTLMEATAKRLAGPRPGESRGEWHERIEAEQKAFLEGLSDD